MIFHATEALGTSFPSSSERHVRTCILFTGEIPPSRSRAAALPDNPAAGDPCRASIRCQRVTGKSRLSSSMQSGAAAAAGQTACPWRRASPSASWIDDWPTSLVSPLPRPPPTPLCSACIELPPCAEPVDWRRWNQVSSSRDETGPRPASGRPWVGFCRNTVFDCGATVCHGSPRAAGSTSELSSDHWN
jgi:hypothetical protein